MGFERVVAFEIDSARRDAALKAGHAKTLQGGEVKIKTEGKAAKVNDATLTTTDLDASNGVIHVIDTVLLPK